MRVLFNSFNQKLKSVYKFSNSEIIINNSINQEHDYASLAIDEFLAHNLLSNSPSKAITNDSTQLQSSNYTINNILQTPLSQKSINKTPQTPLWNSNNKILADSTNISKLQNWPFPFIFPENMLSFSMQNSLKDSNYKLNHKEELHLVNCVYMEMQNYTT
jgi:hypothetical protein